MLNFLGINRIELLTQLLGPEVYLPPTVVAEIGNYAAWTKRDVAGRLQIHPQSVNPAEVLRVENLGRWERRLRAPLARLRTLEFTELELTARYLSAGDLDPGESEVLSVAKCRGWTAVIDEFVAHCHAERDQIPTGSTLSILVNGVAEGRLDEAEATDRWGDIQQWWDYAPSGPLGEYLRGRPIWSPCSD